HSLTKTAFDTVFRRVRLWRAAHSGAASTRSDVRSGPERSALPRARYLACAERCEELTRESKTLAALSGHRLNVQLRKYSRAGIRLRLAWRADELCFPGLLSTIGG